MLFKECLWFSGTTYLRQLKSNFLIPLQRLLVRFIEPGRGVRGGAVAAGHSHPHHEAAHLPEGDVTS